MAAGNVTASWAASFCLGCDKHTLGSDYCSERCHLEDGEQHLVNRTFKGIKDRNAELQYPISRLFQSARNAQLVTASQAAFPGRRHFAKASTTTLSNKPLEDQYDSRYEIFRARPRTVPTEWYSGPAESKTERSTPSDEASDCMATERRDIDVPRVESVGSSNSWDIWKPRSQSLALGTEEIMLRLRIENASTDVRVWDA